MSRERRLLVIALAAIVLLLGGVVVVAQVTREGPTSLAGGAPQEQLGTVLLVPGYGGGTSSLQVLGGKLQRAGREVAVVAAVGDGTGDLREQAKALGQAADTAIASGAPSVDVVGFSAGGVVARLWAKDNPGKARRVVTLGSPHHGTKLAATGAVLAPGACPLGCQQLVPDSDLLEALNDGDETPDGPRWLSLWTTQDEVVTPPETARLDGAVNVVLQDVCPAVTVSHGRLPIEPLVGGIVLQALGTDFPEEAPGQDACAALQAAGA